jgi:hypothetical protein
LPDRNSFEQNLLTTQDIPKANEQAFKNLLDDVEFVEREMKSLGLDETVVGLEEIFGEIKAVSQAHSGQLSDSADPVRTPSVDHTYSERLGAIIHQRS